MLLSKLQACVSAVRFNIDDFLTDIKRVRKKKMALKCSIFPLYLNAEISDSGFSTRQSAYINEGCIPSGSAQEDLFSHSGGGMKYNPEDILVSGRGKTLPMTSRLSSLPTHDLKMEVDNHNVVEENLKFIKKATNVISFSNTVSSLQRQELLAVNEKKKNSVEDSPFIENNVSEFSLNECNGLSARNENEKNMVSYENENHSNDKSFVTSITCDICGKRFNCINELRTHHFICIKDKPHEYTECNNKPFSNDEVFKIHLCKHLCLNSNSNKIHSIIIPETAVDLNDKSDCFESKNDAIVVKNSKFGGSVSGDNTMLSKYEENLVSNGNKIMGSDIVESTQVPSDDPYAKIRSMHCSKDKKTINLVSNGNKIIDSSIVECTTGESNDPHVIIKNLHCRNKKSIGASGSTNDTPKKKIMEQSNLNNQCSRDTTDKLYSCAECGMNISSFDNLKQHLGIPWKEHSIQNSSSSASLNDCLVSQIYTKSLVSKSNVKHHCCDICDKNFDTRKDLLVHLFIHLSVEPHKCTECDEAFVCYDALHEHLVTHSNKKNSQALKKKHYKCKICTSSFVRRSKLNDHLRIHTDAREFRCEFCGKGFNQKSTLKYHVVTHSGEKDYECSICKMRFGLKNSLNRHLRRHDRVMLPKDKENEVSNGNCIKDSGVESKIVESDEPNAKIKNMGCSNDGKTLGDDLNVSGSTYGIHREKISRHFNLNSPCGTDTNNKLYSCAECGMQILSIENLKEHLGIPWQEHSIQNSSSTVSHNDSLVSQIYSKALVPEPNVKHHCCDICDKNFKTREDLLVHLWFHLSVEPHKCTECDKPFVCYDALQKHLVTHLSKENSQGTKKKLYKCKICMSSFLYRTRLNKHLRIHTNAREFRCKLCGKGFNQKSTLKTHMLTHSGEKAHQCSICNMRFGVKTSLNRHLRRHAGIKPYECDVCYYKFDTSGKLKEHYRRHTGERPYGCDICQKTFKRRNSLNAHIASHTGNLPYKCDVCHRKFFLKSTLTAHRQIHTKDKLFVCDICDKSFLRKVGLTHHYRVHTNEKPYVCSYCNKAFSRQTIYDRHILIHTGIQPYECKICQRLFNQKTSLDRHQVVHTKEKPYSCDICKKCFTQKAYLSIHKRTHFKEKP